MEVLHMLGKVLKRIRRIAKWNKTPTLAEKYPHFPIGIGTYGDLTVLSWGGGTRLEIGAYCSFAKGVKVVLGGEHRPDWVTTYPFSVFESTATHIKGHPAAKGDVLIGNDVWIGMGALILSGVAIGDGAVVGAGSVVTKDIPPYAIVGGNPARLLRYRFSENHRQRLQKIAWWKWDKAQIARAIPDLLSEDIDRFINQAEMGKYTKMIASHG
jgi:acetyltransferase-like isoleucine patch superfamily enzyme